jgi:hypothetical protein
MKTMAKQLIEYDNNGSTILVEVDQETEEEAWERVGVVDYLPIIKSKVSFEKALSAIKPVTSAVMTQVIASTPNRKRSRLASGLR